MDTAPRHNPEPEHDRAAPLPEAGRRDPVCGMSVTPSSAFVEHYHGHRYFFAVTTAG